MKVLYLDCGMGAAGDMLTAALYELLPEERRKAFIEKINSLGLEGCMVSAEKAMKCGITGTHMRVTVDGMEEEEALSGHHHDHDHHHDNGHHQDHEHHDHEHHDHEHHDHDHHHDHEHHHSSMADIEAMIRGFDIDEKVREDVVKVYNIIAEAEGRVHDKDITQIHFHEVGTKDAVIDVVSVCMLMQELSADRIIASPVCTGSGSVLCAHGVLPVPAPATANILKDIPVYSGSIEGELCTPTGAALLKYFVDDFGQMPVMKTSAIGYGMGRKDFEKANCIRAFFGELFSEDLTYDESVTVLACNVDDMTGEETGFALERFLEEGASEAFTIPVNMKKSRPGIMIELICAKEDREKMIRLMFKYTTTIGVREFEYKRNILKRVIESTDTPLGSVRVKRSEGYGVKRLKYEFEDLSRIARQRDISLRAARELIEKGESPTSGD